MKKLKKITAIILLVLLLIMGSLYGILHLSSVQTWIIKKATHSLSQQLHTRVYIDKVDFSFFYKLEFQHLLIEDQQKDTLLYAGAARVDLNDWFFAKDKIILKYVGLEDAVINAKRSGVTWNYQFIINFLNQNSTSQKKSNPIQLDLKFLQLNNIKFNYNDGWVGSDMIASIQSLNAQFKKADFNQLDFKLKNIKLSNPYFAQKDYDGNRPSDYKKPSNKNVTLAKNDGNSLFQLSIEKVILENGLYQNDKTTQRAPYHDQFDGFHFQFNSINGELTNVEMKGDNLKAKINLSGKEINGLKIKKIESDMRFTPKVMEFNNLDLITNHSHIKDYYAMHYQSFNDDMIDFITNVKIESKFRNSFISSDDIAIFAPELKDWNKTFYLEGNMNGTIDNFEANNLKIKSGESYINGYLKMKGIPDIDSMYIIFNSTGSQTNVKELSPIAPSLIQLKNQYFNSLGNVYFKGQYAGYLNNFNVKGYMNSGLGNLSGEFNIQLPYKKDAVYKGKINSANIDLGKLTDNRILGNSTFNGSFDGISFDTDKMKLNFKMNASNLKFNDYNYKSIQVEGNWNQKILANKININDSNFRANNINLELNFEKETKTKINGQFDYVNFKAINFIDKNLSLSSTVDAEISGTNIDQFKGNIYLNNIKLKNNEELLSLKFITINASETTEKMKAFRFKSNELEAKIDGAYNFNEIPNAFSYILNKYYPAYIPLTKKPTKQQSFKYEIKTKNIEDYISLFDKKIKGLNNSLLKGELNLEEKKIILDAKIPELIYDGKTISKINLTCNGDKDSLSTNVSISDIIFSDSVHFPETKINLSSTEDNTEIHIKTSASSTLNNADFNAKVQTFNDGVNIHFYPSSFIINDKKWLLDKDGELSIRRNFVNANEIKFSHKNEELVLSSELDEVTNESHLNATIKNVVLQDFIPYVFTNPDVKGKLSGILKITDPLGKATVNFSGKVDSLLLNNKFIGNIDANAKANSINGKIDFSARNIDSTNLFSVNGTYNYKDSVNNPIDISLEGEKIQLSILEPYLGDIFSKIDGIGTSHLRISGNNEHKYITGIVKVNEAALKVDFTQCRYFIQNQSIQFENDLIDLDMLQLKDSLNNTATLNGKVIHHFFDNIKFENINLETGKISLLNTTKANNNQFYGNIIGKAKLNINGPLENLKLNIDGEPSLLDTSHIYLNTSDSKENSSIDYIDFVPFGVKMEDLKNKFRNNIVVNLNINANPSCKVDVILDEETGDIIKGQGNGLINVRVGNIEPLSIRGTYNITKGDYTFNFQTFLKKPFTLNRGIITWNGDPVSANIDIDAEYLAKNVDVSSLSPNIGISKKEDLKIISHLTGLLQHPIVKFDLQLPDKSETKRDDIAVKRLAEFKNDDNEMNKQVASLLLFNAIIVNNQNFLSQGNASSMITSTVGGVISSLLTNFFNKELEKATKGVLSTYIDINPTLDLKKSATQLQANIRAGLKILLSNRLNVLVGGNLDYNNPVYIQQLEKKGLITPDIIVEWVINKDGTLKIIGFNRSSIDLTLNQRNRSGIQLSYRKDVNRISDILRSKKKINENENNLKSPAIKPKED